MIFLVSSGKKAPVFLKNIFSMDRKWKIIFLKKYMETWCFLHIRKIWYFFFLQTWGYSTAKKIKNILLPKNALKDDISSITEKDDTQPRRYDIGILEWHSTKHYNDSLYFYG